MKKRSNGNADKEWKQFTGALADTLSDLGEGVYLILSVEKTNHFVQFAAQGDDGMRVEAKSNYFIEEEEHKLSAAAQRRLLRLGWNEPTYELPGRMEEPAEGSCNYYKDVEAPVPFDEVAELAVRTLREVYDVKSPDDLTYDAFDEEGDEIYFLSLGIRSVDEALA